MASFRAVSREGHAAMSMRGDQDRWIIIQKNTFTNWVNEQLRSSGIEHTEFVEELGTDFESGVKLCRLVESLQGKKIRVIKRPLNHHQQLENVTLALNAIANDNVRLVNIGPEDIVNGNLKLILGLIWHLILRYQIGKTKFPTKKLMLAWLQAVIPECGIGNFTNDWNDGIALSALVDYCRPGLCSNWRHLSRSDGLNNCRNAMQLAKQNFDIPLVLRPEDLASPDLDELSGMTYLSYFMKVDSPGYHATLNMVRKLLKQGSVNNFTSDWHDGRLLCNLAVSLGSSVPGWPNLTGGPVENQQLGIDASIRLGVQPILTAKEMCDPEVDHIGIMAYAAYFSRFKPVKVSAEKVVMDVQPRDCYIGMESNFTIRIEDETVSASDIRAELKGPDSEPHVYLNWSGRTARGSFTPVETGHHRLSVFCEGQLIVGCPLSFKVLADRSKIAFSGVEKCAVGSITELTVNSMSAGQGDVQVEARAPGGRVHRLSAMYRNGNYVMDFTPSEVGVWQISVNYDGEHIQGSPFQIHVYDPAAVKVYGLEGGTVGSGLAFNADTSSAGDGDLRVTVLYEGQPVPAYVTSQRTGLYRIDFTPEGAGTYKVHCYYNDIEVRGSPYTLDIVDSSRVSVRGDGLTLVPVNRVAKFVVETGGSKGRVQVEITGPDKNKLTPTVTDNNNGQHEVEYFPSVAGDYQIYVYYCGQLVNGTAFNCKVFDAGKILVSNMPDHAILGNAVTFNIDASKAGSGNIEIMVNQGRVACNVENLGNYKFVASFIPESLEPYVVEMKFNSMSIYGSPWNIPVFDPKSVIVRGDGLDFIVVGKKSKFTITGARDFAEELFINITAPSGQNVMYDVRSENGEEIVEYTPMEVGDHLIKVEYRENEVEGSPFKAKAYDTSAIAVSPLQDGLVGSPVDFTIDVTRAGEGQLEIMVNNGNLPNTVDMEKTGVYKISFVPEEEGLQTVNINFNSEGLPGSPFTCNAADLTGATVSGLKTLLPTNILSAFTVETISTSGRDVGAEVDIITPSGDVLKDMYICKKTVDGQQVEFRPHQVGDYSVIVKYGKDTLNDQHKFQAFNIRKVKVKNMPSHCFLGNQCNFLVDASEAGEGILEVAILADGDHIPHTLEDLGKGLYEVFFTGTQPIRYRVHMTFNDLYVPGSPFWVEYADETEFMLAEFNKQQFFACRQHAGFTFWGDRGLSHDFSTNIQGPSGMKIPAQIKETSPGKYCVEFVPQEVGSHLVEVFLCGKLVKGFPHVVKVYDSTKVRVITGGNKGYHNIPVEMILDVSQCGEGQIEVVVTSNGITIPSEAEQHGEGRILVTFVPKEGGVYCVNVTFNGESIVGSPFYMDVTGPTKAKMITESSVSKETSIVTRSQQMTLGAQTSNYIVDQQQWIWLEAFGSDILDLSDLELLILAPDGDRIPARILSQSDGNFKVEWTPSKPGRHRVEVQYAGRAVDGSPFYVDVFDLATIRIQNFRQSGIGEPASFELDLKEVGLQDFNVLIRSPGGQIVDHNVANDFSSLTKSISYIPTESGPHEIYVNYITFELPGCPYVQNIDEGGMPTAHGNGLYRGEEDKVATFYVDVGQRQGDLDVRVDGPNSIAKTTIERDGDKFVVSYIPVEVGLFDINITWNGRDVPGSPYHPKVLDARKVRISGGWGQYMDASERVALVVGEEKKLIFDVSQAGPGALRSEVVGPNSNIPVAVEDNYGNTVVSFVPEVEGNHYIHLFWSDIALPSSPFLGYAIPAQPDSNKVILTGRGLKEATVREEAEFVIDGSQAGPGFHGNRKPEVTLTGVRAEISVRVVGIGNGKYRCSYIPVVPGAYLLHITWNGRQLRGSPYKVNVIGAFYPNKVQVSGEGLRGGILGRSMEVFIDTRKAGPGKWDKSVNVIGAFYPNKVQVSGEGLRGGILERNMEVFIDTRKAGPGELTAYCMGPNKAAYCELMDNKDGTFVLRMKPLEVGRHVLQVKYGGEHVNGSPFVLKVAAQPDASKVRVTGPGVEHGILATYQSRFIVETRGAGAGQLTVRIRGPKGGFQVEMYRDSQKDRTILCRYDPTETGLYIISIKWSGVDVPGSPFQVNIVDTQQELEQVLQESFSHSSVSQRSYSQWRQEI